VQVRGGQKVQANARQRTAMNEVPPRVRGPRVVYAMQTCASGDADEVEISSQSGVSDVVPARRAEDVGGSTTEKNASREAVHDVSLPLPIPTTCHVLLFDHVCLYR